MDFNSLFNDPQLQYGLALMDSSRTASPFTNAATALAGLQKNQREQQQLELQKQQAEQMHQFQAVQMQRMTAQTNMEQQQQDIAKQQFMQQQAFYQAMQKSPQFASLFGGQQQQGQPPVQAAPQGMPQGAAPPAPTMQPMQYQEPPQGLAIPPTLPPGAISPAHLAQGNVPQSWQDAADKQAEFDAVAHGNMQQVAGGPQSRPPLSALSPGAPSVQAPMSQAAPGGNPGLDLATVGAMGGLAGIKGGQGLIDVGKMMQPLPVPSGSYLRGPDGQMTFVPDTYKQQQIGQEQQKIDIQQQELGIKKKTQQYEQTQANMNLPQKAIDAVNADRIKEANVEIEKSYQLNKALPNQLIAIKKAQVNITNNPFVGTGADFRKAVVKMYTNLFPGEPLNVNVSNAETFDSEMAIGWMKAAKKVDPNISDKGIDAIRSALGSRGNDPGALKRILQNTYDMMNQDRIQHNNAVQQYTNKAGADPYNRMLPERLPSAQAVAALKANPSPAMMQHFDNSYGAQGYAKSILGQ